MKKVLMILGSIFAVLIVMAAVGIAIVAVKGSALDKESKAYVDQVVPAICADLRIETLSQYASEELLASATPDEFEKIFTWFDKLGKFEEFKESSGQANIHYTTQGGKSITGRYVALVEFETGPAQVKVVTVKEGEDWKIQMFYVSSPALMQ